MREIRKKPYVVPLTEVIVIQQYQNCLLESSRIPKPEIIDDDDDDDEFEGDYGW